MRVIQVPSLVWLHYKWAFHQGGLYLVTRGQKSEEKVTKIIVRLTRGRKKGRKKELKQTRKILKSNFFKEKFREFPRILQPKQEVQQLTRLLLCFYVTIFSNFKQNKQFFKGKKNSENFPRILLKFFKFSNFHSIFKRNFWFCQIHLWNKTCLHSNWERERKKKLQKFIVRLTGEAKNKNFGKFWKIIWKILVEFWEFSKDSIEIFKFSLNLVNESFVPATHRTSIL